jgi:uncharacterized OB-fold protein
MAVPQQVQSALSLNERLVRLDEASGRPYLVATRCPQCNYCFFPKRAICAACGNDGLEETALSGRGRLWSYSIAHQAPPGAVVQPPYVIGQVELPERVLVFALITECAPEEARIGMEVEITPMKVGADEQGRDIMAFAFRPVAAKEGGG